MTEVFGRYDRQLRLWGAHGQQLIENAYIVTVIDNSTDATRDLLHETWKNLILVGVKHLTLVNLSGQKINIREEQLRSLNNDVTIDTTSAMVENKPTILLNVQKDLQDQLFTKTKSVCISCNVTGMLGHMQNYLPVTFFVFDTRDDNQVPDLRLKHPWPEYETFLNSFDEILSDKNSASTVPYPVILFQILKKFGSNIDSKEIKSLLDGFYLSTINENAIYDLNFEEAKRFAYICNAYDDFISKKVRPLLDQLASDETSFNDEQQKKYLILLETLQRYLDKKSMAPFSGEISDLESSTKNFNSLKTIFENKFRSDHELFRTYIGSSNEHLISLNDSSRFIKNLPCTTYVKPSGYKGKQNIAPMIKSQVFIDYWNFYTGQLVENSLLSMSSYSTTTIFAGIIAQEMIKFVTHQYIPIDNFFLFNAVTNYSETIKI